jgi:signal transduction histidine kinase
MRSLTVVLATEAQVQTSASHRLRRQLARLTEPSASIALAGERRRARLIATLALVLAALGVPAVAFNVWNGLQTHDPSHVDDVVGVLAVVGLIGAYVRSRTKHYGRGVAGLIVGPMAGAWGLAYEALKIDHHADVLYFLAIPMVLAPFVVRVRWAVAILGANLVLAILVAPAMRGVLGVSYDALSYESVIWFFGLLTPVVILAAWLQESDFQLLEDRERQLRAANEELKRSDLRRAEIINSVAHDMNQPLTPLRIQVHLLNESGADPTALKIVGRSLDQLQRLVGDLRDVGKIESGQLHLEPRPTDLADLVGTACADYVVAAQEKGVGLTIDCPPTPLVDADALRIRQVVHNLLTNGLKFTPAAGHIRARTMTTDGGARVEIADSGRGLTPDEIGRLFQPFSQVHGRGEVKERGTGLGLYICRRLVESHGGQIGVASAGRGQGSTFWFQLPRSTAPAGAPPAPVG